jgi:outer membrane lipoprotein-sorting protein
MQLHNRCLLWVVVGTIFLLLASLAQAAEFSAKVITKAGGMEMPGKMYIKGEKARNEVQMAGHSTVQIMRPDKKVVWVIMPQQKAYMEMSFTQDHEQKMLKISEQAKANMKKIGTETVNGYECDKYETTMGSEGKSPKQYIWVALKLGVPIKMVTEDGSMSLEYKDIKPEKLEDSLFELPQGYRKMQIPLPMGSMMK